MKYFIFILLSFAPLNSLSAALPPLFQGMREIKAIFDDPDTLKYLDSGDVITDIKKTETGYLITTNKKEVLVEIVYESSSVPGPVKFHLRFPAKTNKT